MTPSVARVIDMLDAERLAVAEALGLSLMSLPEALSSAGLGPKGTTWQTLNGSQTLTFIKGPTSLKSRYLAEDIPYGLLDVGLDCRRSRCRHADDGCFRHHGIRIAGVRSGARQSRRP